jgi:hypothetical protein
MIDVIDHLAHGQHRHHRRDAARSNCQAGLRRVPAERAFAQGRYEDDCREQHGADQEVVGGGDRKIDVPENLKSEQKKP